MQKWVKINSNQLIDVSRFVVINLFSEDKFYYIQGQYENGNLYNIEYFQTQVEAMELFKLIEKELCENLG